MAPAVLAQQQSAEAIQKALTSESAAIATWGSDKVFVDATKAQNAKKVKLTEIETIDKEWIAGKADDAVKRVTTGPCADHLRQLVAQHAGFGEAFVMDDQGALVCANSRTSEGRASYGVMSGVSLKTSSTSVAAPSNWLSGGSPSSVNCSRISDPKLASTGDT